MSSPYDTLPDDSYDRGNGDGAYGGNDGEGGSSGDNPGDSSGGGGDNIGSPVVDTVGIEEVALDEGGLLALAYGEHLVAGHLVYAKRTEGPPPSLVATYLTGEGEWDSIVAAWYASEAVPLSPDGSTEGYHFHPGTLSSGVADPVQGEDTFTPGSNATYNKTANTVVKLPQKFAAEVRPDKWRARYKCLKVNIRDSGGNITGYAYTTNPAYETSDILVERGKMAAARIDWSTWALWWEWCNSLIAWNDGASVLAINRFEGHPVFVAPADLPDMLDAMCQITCCRWQDDGNKIRFLRPIDTTPVHTFRSNNIEPSSLKVYPLELQSLPRHIVIKFRDVRDPYLGFTSVEARRDSLIAAYGDKVSERNYPNMNHSQAKRIAEYLMRLETDYYMRSELSASSDSLHVLPGDFVKLDFGITNIDGDYLTLEAVDNSPEHAPDSRWFKLQKITGPLYSDDDHTPVQRAVTPP